jgi:hypothetical protein
MRRRSISSFLITCLMAGAAAGQYKESKPKTETKESKIARALSAAPANIAKGAKVVEQDENGKETTLREGSNGFTCFPGHPGVVGAPPFCANAPALQWEADMAQHKPKPTNTEPGIEYMLAGGSDWSATDPNATSGAPVQEPPHWMILWPFDAGTTGLPTTAKQTGSWIMYAGTPWAHLMINQRP